MRVVTLEAHGGKISDIIRNGIITAKRQNCEVHFDASFWGVNIILAPDSEFEIVMRDYERARNNCIAKTIGPHYEKELDKQTIEREKNLVEKLGEISSIKVEAELQLEKAERLKVITLLNYIQPKEMTFLDEESRTTFRKLADSEPNDYEWAIFQMTEDLARLLEFKLGPNGTITEELLDDCESMIFGDLHGATGFQTRTALNLLVLYWSRGAELLDILRDYKRWE